MFSPFRSATVLCVLAAASLSACASAPAGSSASTSPAPGASAAVVATAPVAQSSRYVLVQADLQGAKSDNLYDAIKKLRPDFITGKADMTYVPPSGSGPVINSKTSGYVGATDAVAVLPGQGGVMVYLDGAKLNGVDDLHSMSTAGVREVRYLQAKEAIIRFGANHGSGAILITSAK